MYLFVLVQNVHVTARHVVSPIVAMQTVVTSAMVDCSTENVKVI